MTWKRNTGKMWGNGVFILYLHKAVDIEGLGWVTGRGQTCRFFLRHLCGSFFPSCLSGHANMPSRATEDRHSSLDSCGRFSAPTAGLPGFNRELLTVQKLATDAR